MISPVAATLIGFVVITAVATALFRDVLASIIVFGAYSLGMAILYTFLRAPDVAMTEAAIGAGVTTLLLLLTIAKTVRPSYEEVFESVDGLALAVTGLFAIAVFQTLGAFPDVGSQGLPWGNSEVTQYYIEHSYADTGATNAVTAVLAAYRGFDTFGEAVVVFAAGIAVLVVLRREVFTQ